METLIFFITIGVLAIVFGTWYLRKMKKEEHHH
jgi:hypothetical protein